MSGVTWEEREGVLEPKMKGHEVAWAWQEGSQKAFLKCPLFEVLIEGNRGGGKTDALVMDFAQHVGRGHGAEWRGILFRQTYPQLVDIVEKTKKWFPRIFPAACFNESKMRWTWPEGESLRLSYMEREADYWNYHGHAYPWIGWEELTTWPDDKCYKVMLACSRSTKKNMPRKYRATTNPYGPGHNWVKMRFKLPVTSGRVVGRIVRDENLLARVAIHGSLNENKILLAAEPDYLSKIAAAARNPSERKAWIEGSWDIVAGGMFDDLWRPEYHVIPDLPLAQIPADWTIDISYDYGQSKPFSVGWWAESNGEPMEINGRKIGAVPGDVIRIAEWYGWTGEPNEGVRMRSAEIADGIVEREKQWGIRGRVEPGPADSSIFDELEEKSIAGDMEAHGVEFVPADKRPGSRKQGWNELRNLLAGAIPNRENIREKQGIFVCERCDQFIRTFPVLPRDGRDPDDVDTKSEDHIADETRYRVRVKRRIAESWSW